MLQTFRKIVLPIRHIAELQGDLKKMPRYSDDFYTSEVLEKIPLVMEPTEVELVVVSAFELGFKSHEATPKKLFERASQLGLDVCPAQVGPELRIAYQDQPRGEKLLIAMDPIIRENGFGDECVFMVSCYDAGWYRALETPIHSWNRVVLDCERWFFARK